MRESLGARLRRRREEQRIALDTIADQTKIKLSLLEALERDDASRWPSGIFRRAYIRAYAAAIGLDPDEVVREFLELHPDPAESVATIWDAPGADVADHGSGSPPMRLRYLVGAAVGSLFRSRPEPQKVSGWGPELNGPAAAEERENSRCETGDPPCEETPDAAPDPPFAPDLSAAADLCARLTRLEEIGQAKPLLEETAAVLDAIGVIVWAWHGETAELRPELAYGYSDQVLRQLPKVGRDASNATAAAFRSVQPCVVHGGANTSGALAVPIAAPRGCVGVLAVELRPGREQLELVRALVTIFAAQLSRLVNAAAQAPQADRKLA
jgi:transcriptional regulator with XRE-family HTH domain